MVLGLAVLIFGVAEKQPIVGVGGFVIMLGAAALGIQAFRRGRHPELRSVGGTAARRTGGSPSRRRGSFIDRLEDRWRNRPEGDF